MEKQPTVDYKALGTKMREKRLQLGLTQADVAERNLLTESAYNRIERGSRPLNVDNLVRISNFYGLSLDFLLSDSTHNDNLDDISDEIGNIFRGKSEAQTRLLLNLLKMCARNIDELMQ
ncbi:MAG: helix-turn-helix transcriptional regulator [Defluviitaleaceae bacterium]|nr:helix-turn-helix transcriptional regulator [Defluviitaleaceae bacterium]